MILTVVIATIFCLTSHQPQPSVISLNRVDVEQGCLVSALPDCRYYVALSYVWGGVDTLGTTKANKRMHQQPGMLSSNNADLSIPETIRDAMRLVYSLGERYLWVDCLCIVQDDKKQKPKPILFPGVFTMVCRSFPSI